MHALSTLPFTCPAPRAGAARRGAPVRFSHIRVCSDNCRADVALDACMKLPEGPQREEVIFLYKRWTTLKCLTMLSV